MEKIFLLLFVFILTNSCAQKLDFLAPGFTAPSAITVTAVTSTSVTFTWTNGNLSSRIIVMKAGTVDANPVNGVTYTASATFGSGSQIGTANYVVAIGTGPVTVTGLTQGTTYGISIFESSGTVYYTQIPGRSVTASLPLVQNIAGIGKISGFTPCAPGVFGCTLNTDGKYYFTVMGRADKARDPYVYKYNGITNVVEQEFRLQLGQTSIDTHRIGTIANDSDGNIFVCCEKLYDPDTHGGDILIYKTTVPYDITTLTLFKTLTGRWSYPTIQIIGNNIWVSGRGTSNPTAFSNEWVMYYYSTDAGATFTGPIPLYYTGGGDNVAYHWRIHSYDGGVYLIFNERNNTLQNWTFVAMLKGNYTGTVWSNVDGSWTKDVSGNNYLTRSDLMTNCMVLQSPDAVNIAVNNELGIVKSDGTVKLLISVQSLTGNYYIGNPETQLDELRFYTFSSGSWHYNNVNIPNTFTYYWAYTRMTQYLSSNQSYDDVVYIDRGDHNKVYVKRSYDNFATESSTLISTGNDYHRLGLCPYNITNDSQSFITLVETIPPADLFKDENEAPEDYSDLKLIRFEP